MTKFWFSYDNYIERSGALPSVKQGSTNSSILNDIKSALYVQKYHIRKYFVLYYILEQSYQNIQTTYMQVA